MPLKYPVSLKYYCANQIWRACAASGHRRFIRAIRSVRQTQEDKLQNLLRQNVGTSFGNEFNFSSINSLSAFRERVPLATYDDLQPWIEAIRAGEPRVLTAGRVERLHATSGTTSASKYIPFGDALRREFFAGIAPWMGNLLDVCKELRGGSSYWIVSPAIAEVELPSSVPISYDQDENYLPWYVRLPQRALSAVSAARASETSYQEIRYQTVKELVCDEHLALISVWNPSYLQLLLETVLLRRDQLLEELSRGSRQEKNRASQLKKFLPQNSTALDDIDWERVWPRLALISCWADGWASEAADSIRRIFPGTLLQAKGLLATEAFVTLPFISDENNAGAAVLSVNSHVFEFIDMQSGEQKFADQLDEGHEYEVVVTTGGGLYRYRLGDVVACEGHFFQAPRLRFIKKLGIVADMSGEKLNEEHVERSLRVCSELYQVPKEALFITPDHCTFPPSYRLFVKDTYVSTAGQLRDSLEELFKENVHYAHSRSLGQLGGLRLELLAADAWNTFRFEGFRRSTAKSLSIDISRGER